MLERTREIDILRRIGARARHIRRIFTAEGLTLALIGWIIGVPLGHALDRCLTWLFSHSIELVTQPPNPVSQTARLARSVIDPETGLMHGA